MARHSDSLQFVSKFIPREGYEKQSTEKKKIGRLPVVEKDSTANRTLVISNLTHAGLTNSVLWKKIRKYGGAESVVWPVDGDNTKGSTLAHIIVPFVVLIFNSNIAHAIFETPAAAAAALPRLHSHVYKGSVLSVILKKQVDFVMTHPSSSTPNRAGRLIVRNLPWNVSFHQLSFLHVLIQRIDF